MALLEKAARQGHVYAMSALAATHRKRTEHEQAIEWISKAAEAGLPNAMFNLGYHLDSGDGVAAADCPAAADWYKRAADVGVREAANNLSRMYTVGRGWAWQIMPASACRIVDPHP
jgi:TPR repeat protein